MIQSLLMVVGLIVSLIWSRHFLHYYDDIKFLIIGVGSAIIWLWSAWSGNSKVIDKRIEILWGIFLISGFVSAIFALNPLKASQGLTWWLTLSGISCAARAVSEKKGIFLKGLIFPVFFILVYGWFQILGFEPLGLPHDHFPVSTLGYKNMVGEFYVLVVPIFLILLCQLLAQKNMLFIPLIFLVGLMGGHLCFTYSRSNELALAVEIIVLALFFFSKKRGFLGIKPFFISACLVLVVTFISIFFASKIIASKAEPTGTTLSNSIPSIINETLGHSDSWSTRKIRWANSLWILKDHLWFGIGPNQYEEIYPLYSNRVGKDPEENEHLFVHHAHNEYLQIFIEHGILGGLMFILFVIFIIFQSFRRCLKQPVSFETLGCAVALIGLSVSSLFSFSPRNPVTGFLAAMFIGFLVSQKERKTGESSIFLFPLFKSAIAGVILFMTISSAFSSYFLEKARIARVEGRLQRAAEFTEKSIDATPWKPLSYFLHCQNLAILRKSEALHACLKLTEMAPNHYVAYGYMGYLCHIRGNYKLAIKFYEKALIIKPDFPRIERYLKQAKDKTYPI